MLDLHVIHVVKNGINYYSASRDRFDPLFPYVGEALLARMFAWLGAASVHFDLSYSGKPTGRTPSVYVELTEQLYDTQPLGNMANSRLSAEGVYEPYGALFTSQSVRLNVYSSEIDGIRVLHRIIQASMLLFHNSLISAGYQNILYQGTTQLIPEDGLTGEGIEVYARQISYAALALLEIPLTIDTAAESLLDIQVQLEDYTPAASGVQGGVAVE